MPFKRHPSRALLLSALNRTAPAAKHELVIAHLATCIRCRTVANRYETTLRELNAFGKSQEAPGRPRMKARLFRGGISKTVALRVSLGAIAIALFALMFLWFRHFQPVDAAEIFSQAEGAQAPAKE